MYKYSYCRFCLAFCGIKIKSNLSGQIENIVGNEDDPISGGYTCEKGRNIHSYYSSENRLDSPLVDGKRVPWEVALNGLSSEIEQYTKKYGPEAIALYCGTASITDATGIWTALGFMYRIKSKMIYTVSTIDAVSKTFVANELTGGTLPGLIPQIDYENTDCVLFIGTNPLISHGHLAGNTSPQKKIRAIRNRGGKVVLIDPRITETAKYADLHLAPNIGSDWVLLGYIINNLIHDNITTHKNPVKRSLAGIDRWQIDEISEILECIDIKYTQEKTGLSADEIKLICQVIVDSKYFSTVSGTGVSFSRTAILTEWLLWILSALKGSLDRSGGVIFNPGYPQHSSEKQKKQAIADFWPERAVSREELPARRAEQPCSALADAILADKVKVLISIGGSIYSAFPNHKKISKALKHIPVSVDLNTHFSEANKKYKYVLPVCGQLERADSTIYAQNSLEFYGVRYTNKITQSYGQSKPAWEVFAKLGEILGLDVTKIGKTSDKISDMDILKSIGYSGNMFEENTLLEKGIHVHGKIPIGWVTKYLPNGKWKLVTPPLKSELKRFLPMEENSKNSFRVLAFREKGKLNSMLIDQQKEIKFFIYIHLDDAAQLLIKNNDIIKITTNTGYIEGPAYLTSKILKKTVGVPHGYLQDMNVAKLVSDDVWVSRLSGMPTQTGFNVSVES
jgi:anaerobic selenocysteine-containing dehydrogenase